MDWASFVADLHQNWLHYLSMPLIAAAIGYGTKVVAIRMMFEPIEFVGIRPYLGWQGIVPRRAARMAAITCDTMTSRVVRSKDIFARLDPDRVAHEIEGPLLEVTEEITKEVVDHYQKGLWEALPETLRGVIIRRIQAEAPRMVSQIMAEIRRKIDTVFDLKDMVVTNLLRDKALLNRMFQEAGEHEFRFIAHSGIYFGSIIGAVQAVAWALTHSPIIMPLFGLFTGWFTDWLALKMIFYPRYPTRYFFGLIEWQGLFQKRRKEVTAAYGALTATEVLTPRNIINAILRGPLSDRLFAMVQKQVQRMIDEQAGLAKPLVVFAVGTTRYREMKQIIADKVIEKLPDTVLHIEKYAEDALDIRNTLVTKMQELTPEEFEQVLRPAFQQDEWILIAVGAALGFIVGELQVFLMLEG